jgi:hypothetical protein
VDLEFGLHIDNLPQASANLVTPSENLSRMLTQRHNLQSKYSTSGFEVLSNRVHEAGAQRTQSSLL